MSIITRRLIRFTLSALCLLPTLTACDSTDDYRIPSYRVHIALDNPGLWQVYGVAGYGDYRCFIRQTREPANFPFSETTYTGFGGVLLIMGMNPFNDGAMQPLAYDLACPVECRENVRVKIDPTTLDAVCPLCESHYDVTMGVGAPLSGPALTYKYRLRNYGVHPSNGGFIITG